MSNESKINYRYTESDNELANAVVRKLIEVKQQADEALKHFSVKGCNHPDNSCVDGCCEWIDAVVRKADDVDHYFWMYTEDQKKKKKKNKK